MVAGKKVSELEILKWDVTYKAHKEYIDHFAFILGPCIDKLPIELVVKIIALPEKVGVEVKLASHYAPKFTTLYDTTIADGAELGEVDVADDTNIVA